MIRYTTPNIVLCVPIDITDSDKVIATFAQRDVRIDKDIEKSNMSVQNGKTVIEVSLTQKETEKFRECRPVIVQVNFFKGSTRAATIPRETHRLLTNALNEVEQ